MLTKPNTGAQKNKKFENIKQRYKQFYDSFYKKGKLPLFDTEKGIWGTSHADNIYSFFKKIHLSKSKTFIDLGSGDGIVVLIASLFGVKAVGIEFDQKLVNVSKKIMKELNLKAKFIKGDFLKHNLSEYDIIFINPDQSFSLKFENKLQKEMKPKARLYIYNNIFLPNTLKKGKTYWYNQIPIICYRK